MTDPMFQPNHRYTRRHAIGLAALGAAALAGIPGCGGGSSGTTAGTTAAAGSTDPESFKGQTLNLFTWASYAEKEWLAEYEKLRGVKINAQLYGSVPGGFAKVQANPEAFDLVVPTSGWVETYADADLIVPIDEGQIENMANVTEELNWREATEYKGDLYGVLYNWGNEPLCWLPDKVNGTPDSWRFLYEPSLANGKVSLVDDPTTVMPFIPIMLGFEEPFDLDEQQFQEMSDALMELKGPVNHLSASIEDQTNDFANGQVTAGVLYNVSTQVALRENGVTLEQAIPKEGAAVWTDNYALTKAGEQKAALCYDFINYTLSVPWQARFAAETSNTSVLTLEEAESEEAVEAGLDKKALDATLLPLTSGGEEFFSNLKVLKRVPNLEEWLNLWNEFKTGL
ncbi:MAG: extracellular solute-binding protein [Solirubrobacterales bacterium]